MHCIIISIVPFFLLVLAAPLNPTLKTNFEQWQDNDEYTRDKAEDDFGTITEFDVDGRATIETDDDDNDGEMDDRVLRVKFPQDKTGITDTGMVVIVPLKAARGYTLEYKAKFVGDNFDFVNGGALPGLGNGIDDGYLANFIWKENGRLAVNYSQPGDEADSILETGYTIKPNEWIDMKLLTKITGHTMEESEEDDTSNVKTTTDYTGNIKVWINDKLVLNKKDLIFTSPSKQITELDLMTYYTNTGIVEDSTTQTDQYIDFAEISVSQVD